MQTTHYRTTNSQQHALILTALQRSSKRPSSLSIAVALSFGLLFNSSPAQVLLDEDFSGGSLDGWSIVDTSSVSIGQPWGPGIAEVRDGELRLSTTGEVPARSIPGGPGVTGAMLLTLDRSADDARFNDGYLRSTFRVDTESNADFVLRGDAQTFSGYVFAAAPNRNEFIINRFENGVGVELAIAGANEGIDFGVGENWNIEVGAVGNELSLRAWEIGEVEPEAPQLVISDDTFTSGAIGMLGAVEAWYTPGPVRLDVSFEEIGFRTHSAVEPNSEPGTVVYMTINDSITPPTGRIVRYNTLDSTQEVLITETLGSPSQIAVDEANGHLYWALASPGDTPSVRRSNLDGTDVVTVADEPGNSHGVAVDSGNAAIFYTNRNSEKFIDPELNPFGARVPIRRLDLQTGESDALIESTHGAQIELHLADGKMYWVDAGILFADRPGIRRANLDGTEVEGVVELELGKLVAGFAIDHASEKLVWAQCTVVPFQPICNEQQILQANLDGTEETVLLETNEQIHCCGEIDIHDGRLYWLDDDTLKTAELNSLDQATSLTDGLPNTFRGPYVAGLRVYLPQEGDLNIDGDVDADDITFLAEAIASKMSRRDLDLDDSDDVDLFDYKFMVTDVIGTWFGDANLDGEFSSTDLVSVFRSNKFETGQPATWGEGDWDADGLFSSSDLVAAFRDGGYEQGPRASIAVVPEPSSKSLFAIGLLVARLLRRTQQTDADSGVPSVAKQSCVHLRR